MPLLAGRDLHLSAKGRLYFACVHSVIRYGNETWPLKEGVIRLERNDEVNLGNMEWDNHKWSNRKESKDLPEEKMFGNPS